MTGKVALGALRVALATVLAMAWATRSDAVTIFFTDFESGTPAEVAGAGGVVGSQGYSAHGFGSFLYRNDSRPPVPTALTLIGLPAHTTLSLSFLLAAIASWDGSGGAPFGPDSFNITVDGASVFSHTFNNFNVNGDSYPDAPLTFGGDLFVDCCSFPDSAYAISLAAIPHSAGTATISFFASGAGWQGSNDESWAIDNIQVDLDAAPVPEPTSLVLMSLGAMGLAVQRRRNRTKPDTPRPTRTKGAQ